MKILKLTFREIMIAMAWIGSIWFIIGILAFSNQVVNFIKFPISYTPGMIIERAAVGWMIISGTILALIGGLIARPRYLWPVLGVSGGICFIFALVYISYDYLLTGTFSSFLLYMVSGIACVIGGSIIRWLRMKEKVKSSVIS
jgi:hypothetical protein